MELVDLLGVDLASLGWVRPSWWDGAACRGEGVPRWFPAEGGGSRQRRLLDDARRACVGCPVVAPCLEVALEIAPSVDRSGVFGGTDWRQRAVLRRLGSPGEVARLWAAGSIVLERRPRVA